MKKKIKKEPKKANALRSIGIVKKDKKIWLYLIKPKGKRKKDIYLATGENGNMFFNLRNKLSVSGKSAGKEYIAESERLNIAKLHVGYFMTCLKRTGSKSALYGAVSRDLVKWKNLQPIAGIGESGVLVPEYLYNGKHVMYIGEENIRIAFSTDLKKWDWEDALLKPRSDNFDSSDLTVGQVFVRPEGIVLIYYAKNKDKRYAIGVAQFDRNNPSRLIWRSDSPLWEEPRAWAGKKARPVGVAELDGDLVSYWETKDGLTAVFIPGIWFRTDYPDKVRERFPRLERVLQNPIIKPRPERKWESKATFNPTAIFKRGKVHIIYRAIGDDDVSRLGYATSRSGYEIDESHPEPIYVPTEPFEGAVQKKGFAYSTTYMSGGGGCGGCEDPRITEIGDRIYLTYVAYDGCNPPRVALSSISVEDFRAGRWDWTTPVLISKPGVVDKNACLLPEKVKGKYVIFHRVYPNILVDFVDDLDFDGRTKFLKGEYAITPSRLSWDSKKVGIGPTPIRTERGWLAIYQAVGRQDSSKYKIGAMLLDLNNPAKVLYRSRYPILEPVEWYENGGFKAGVVYPCGAVIKNKELIVYYGGADSFVCAASGPVNKFMDKLIKSETPSLERVMLV